MSGCRRDWQFDENAAAGVDYQQGDVARHYDTMHQRIRDYRMEAEAILDRLGLNTGSTVIDLGAGTGAFAIPAAEHCRRVYAVDVSAAMLAVCREKAAKAALTNVVCVQGGFLSYEHEGPPVDAVVSVAALHHLPDFWKAAALRRCAEFLRPGGRLYLFDIVFPSDAGNLSDRIEGWIRSIGERAGPEMAEEAAVHIREEHSTFDWVMEGLLKGAGFRIESADCTESFQAAYLCVREE